ncbi:MAG TPA: hypothetical protein VK254_01735 [Candidatus Bathyarchaeia archaeon]|nr:hypothetical protein [Candidatus Bathyarchaeia archaeon]
MKDLLKYTYLLDLEKIDANIEKLWNRYQKILDDKKSTWEDLNEARAILFFLGHMFTEEIALGSLEKRVKFIKPMISLDNFLLAVDRKDDSILKKYKNNKNFAKLRDFYLLVKGIKNRRKGEWYLDEKRFNEVYDKKKPKDYF